MEKFVPIVVVPTSLHSSTFFVSKWVNGPYKFLPAFGIIVHSFDSWHQFPSGFWDAYTRWFFLNVRFMGRKHGKGYFRSFLGNSDVISGQNGPFVTFPAIFLTFFLQNHLIHKERVRSQHSLLVLSY